jgi:hypothetical protein
MTERNRKSQRRRHRAQSLVETMAGLIVIIPVFLCLFDIVMVYIGYNTNLTACRDACRAASTADPPANTANGDKTAGNAFFDRAQSICDSLKQAEGGYVKGPNLDKVTVTNFVDPGPLGGNYQGNVSVTTSIVVRLPASIPKISPETIPISTSNTFPLTSSKNTFKDGTLVR